ncbi:hypothetical protein PO124_25410 [Bacillus licheniformis]|nr:hypothetical protein [Bacillus licheniformis]
MQYHNLIRMLGGIFSSSWDCSYSAFPAGFMMKERRFRLERENRPAEFNAGRNDFAAGWTPCIGPIFGTIAYANFRTLIWERIHDDHRIFFRLCHSFLLMAFLSETSGRL